MQPPAPASPRSLSPPLSLSLLLLAALQLVTSPVANALLHEQVAFDNSDVCWWSLIPPDLVCPVLRQQNLTDIVNSLAGPPRWTGGDDCVGKYCLYNSTRFAGGRGIAAITTAENIAKIREAGDLLHQYEVSFNDGDENLPFHVAEVEGKGNGVIANHRLARGDPIMAHTPVLLIHQAFKEEPDLDRQHHLLDLALKSLPARTADLFMGQMAHNPEEHPVAARLTTNAFRLDLGGDDGQHYGAFPEVGKTNHDCRPNAAYHVDQSTLMHITTAVRPVKAGEEITITYLDPLAPRADRQERAQSHWGFGCTCPHCSATADEVAESDTRLKELKWIEGQLQDLRNTSDVSVGLITYLLKLYEDERLHCRIANAYILAALNFNVLGYDQRAAKYASLAIDALKIEKGEASPHVEAMEELKRDPKGHSTFKGRRKQGGK
ncbi:putative het domain protein [Diaporthe ampelina]|uniref:Putative het domain protein n=1 Tax=Diaporthe ampelina TaxID=1214573 RepID=A0A0G2FB61_9PEZI|nr:putative het domain protein [Diaporthe ampelina]